MSQSAGASNAKPFVAGLAIGLVVGGLAGAYLGGFVETGSMKVKPAPKSGTPAATAPTGPRDERPDVLPAVPTGEPAPTGAPTPATGAAPK